MVAPAGTSSGYFLAMAFRSIFQVVLRLRGSKSSLRSVSIGTGAGAVIYNLSNGRTSLMKAAYSKSLR